MDYLGNNGKTHGTGRIKTTLRSAPKFRAKGIGRMKQVAIEIFALFGGIGGLVLLIRFLVKESIHAWIQKDLESHKTELKKEADKEIEILKTKNEMVISEFKERFTHLSKRRIETIEAVSSKLIELWAAIEGATLLLRPVSNESRHERSRRETDLIVDRANALLKEFVPVEIFFPTSLSNNILEFRKKVSVVIDVWGRTLCRPMTDSMFDKTYDDFCQNLNGLKPRFEEIRVDLRKLLGVE
jgi:hypothetical protein